MTPWQKPSMFLAFASWASVFALMWLLILGKLRCDSLTLSAWLFFFGTAFTASAVASYGKEGDDDKENRNPS
jgi:hypothetical protein